MPGPIDFDVLAGLDPNGAEARALCAIAVLALGALIALGFGLIGRRNRRRGAQGVPDQASPGELGLVGLWRLDRSMHRRSSVAPHVETHTGVAEP